jgi:hypothetical protein
MRCENCEFWYIWVAEIIFCFRIDRVGVNLRMNAGSSWLVARKFLTPYNLPFGCHICFWRESAEVVHSSSRYRGVMIKSHFLAAFCCVTFTLQNQSSQAEENSRSMFNVSAEYTLTKIAICLLLYYKHFTIGSYILNTSETHVRGRRSTTPFTHVQVARLGQTTSNIQPPSDLSSHDLAILCWSYCIAVFCRADVWLLSPSLTIGDVPPEGRFNFEITKSQRQEVRLHN